MCKHSGDETQHHPVTVPGLVSPALVKTLRAGGVNGVVTDSGTIDSDEVPDNTTLRLEADIPPGTEVEVKLRNGKPYCKPKGQARENDQDSQQNRKRDPKKDEQRAKAEAFWNQFESLPDHDIARKGRRSELLRGSSGTGVTSRTVNHFYVLEPIDDGRLQRNAESFLCNDDAQFRFTDGVRKEDADGNEYMPPVTCQRCLRLMERWKVSQ